MMKQPKKLSLKNKKLAVEVGLDPSQWMNLFEDDLYLHLVDNANKNKKIIDKVKGVIINNEES